MPDDKTPKSLLLIPIAVALCCLVPILLLLATTGAATSFIKGNKVGIVVFGVLAVSLAVYLLSKSLRNKDDCC